MSEFDVILDTPEESSAPVVHGGFLLRFVAYIIDSIVTSIPVVALGYGILGSTFDSIQPGDTPEDVEFGSMGLYWFVSIILPWLYYAFMESSNNQATLGKMALNMKVTSTDGNRISFFNATGRYFGKFISAVVLLIGFVMIAFTENKQGLHDLMAKTFVVKK